MNESIHRYFQVGLISFMAYPSTGAGNCPNTLDYLARIARDDYFDAIEVNWIKDSVMRERARDLFAGSHLSVFYGAQPRLLTTGLNPCHTDEAERQKAEQTLLQAVDEALFLGAKSIAFFSGKAPTSQIELAWQQLIKTTKAVCAYAKTKGLSVALEVFDHDVDKKALIGSAPTAARFAAEIRETCSNFGLLADLSHFPLTRETSRFVIQTLRPYLVHFHIGNAVANDPMAEAYGDEHPRFGFPNSSIDAPELAAFLAVLKGEGFFCPDRPYPLSFEVKPRPGEDPELVIANAKRTLNRAWAML